MTTKPVHTTSKEKNGTRGAMETTGDKHDSQLYYTVMNQHLALSAKSKGGQKEVHDACILCTLCTAVGERACLETKQC